MTVDQSVKEALDKILGTGINQTGKVMALLYERGFRSDTILPAVYQYLLVGKLDPKGSVSPCAN